MPERYGPGSNSDSGCSHGRVEPTPGDSMSWRWFQRAMDRKILKLGEALLQSLLLLGRNRVIQKTVNDFHATILHLLGLNHEKLPHKFQGRNFRLTDVAGNVVSKVLA
ncbi:MAG TPA: DUF1501 domain-containing protein [Pirellulaceae bacterium]|nr:DUF1501 domain-containing protein [Pirellulaceae bacterium]